MANGDIVGEENVPDGDMEAQIHQHGVLDHDVIDDHDEDSHGATNEYGAINDHGEDPHETYHEEEDQIILMMKIHLKTIMDRRIPLTPKVLLSP